MRRWVLILLLLVYPFQVALAMADKCCVMTSAGVSHHPAAQDSGMVAADAAFVADDGCAALSDPHCPACTFAHGLYLPAHGVAVPAERHPTARITFIPPRLTPPPVDRPERPKWPAAAH